MEIPGLLTYPAIYKLVVTQTQRTSLTPSLDGRS